MTEVQVAMTEVQRAKIATLDTFRLVVWWWLAAKVAVALALGGVVAYGIWCIEQDTARCRAEREARTREREARTRAQDARHARVMAELAGTAERPRREVAPFAEDGGDPRVA